MTSSSHNPIDWSASQIADRIRARDLSVTEVVEAFIARIADVNPALNAVVIPRFDQARAAAAAADQHLRSLSDRAGLPPLFGVPVTIKECFHLAGTPSTIGLTGDANGGLAAADGAIVSRLLAAGAIILGKTNLPQLMIWHESDNPVYGRTNNPWNLERTCGGSSGGEAAIIAARGSPLGLANDLGGSIRIPCHFCGVHGLRPTSHRLSRTGARRTLRGFEAIVTQAGPIARHVADLSLALGVLIGADSEQRTGDGIPVPLHDHSTVDLSQLRIATWSSDGVFPSSPAVQRAVSEASAALRKAGATIVPLDPQEVEKIFHPSEAFDLYCNLVSADGGADARRIAEGSVRDPRVARLMWIAGLSPAVRATLAAGLHRVGQHWQSRIVRNARRRSTDAFWQLVERKNNLVSRIFRALHERRIDALLCPPYALPAPPHVRTFDLLAASSYSLLINLLGLPSGTFSLTRVKTSEENSRPRSRDKVLAAAALADRASAGMPIGVQVSALPWREDVVLALMQALETESRANPDYPISSDVPVLPA